MSTLFLSSIHKVSFSNNTFDAIYICGGLHHVLPLLNETIVEIHRTKPGGLFYFMEPNKAHGLIKFVNYGIRDGKFTW